jgi:predicted dithiol-disulfide oxidoreductase (DUF899 family)
MDASKDTSEDIASVQLEIARLSEKLRELHAANAPKPVKNYEFETSAGKVSLRDLFGTSSRLLVIHNMGQGCRYCTLWADGFNGLLPHLENAFSVVVVSKDPPDVQRTFALSRGWGFRMASHGGGAYALEQSTIGGEDNMAGVVLYERKGDDIVRRNASSFGPGDLFCAQWHLLSLAGVGTDGWTPQYAYWKRPGKMDDGGQNLDALSAGGKVEMPLTDMFWGDYFGCCADRFGVQWMFTCSSKT